MAVIEPAEQARIAAVLQAGPQVLDLDDRVGYLAAGPVAGHDVDATAGTGHLVTS